MPPSDAGTDFSEENSQAGGLTEERKAALSRALDAQGKQKQTAVILRPYTRFARWWARSENTYVNWYNVLDKGLAWMSRSFGKYSKSEFKKKYCTEISTYGSMALGVKCFELDLPYFEDQENQDRKNDLVKAMNAASAAARSEDISSLSRAILVYVEEADPDNKLVPAIKARVNKSESRGFKHPVLGRLLCPIKYHDDFDKNAAEFLKKLDNGTVKVRSRDMPSFLWPKDGYDPDQMDANMFRNPLIVMVWKHIFTCPSSALKNGPGQTKTKSSQAKLNKMTSVTPGSIAYACLMIRHSISNIEDWRMEDKLFKREEFFKYLVDLFEDDANDSSDWIKDTIEWWNAEVFGTEPDSVDDSDNELGPSTTTMIRAQRQAQRAQKAVSEDPEHSPASNPPSPRRAPHHPPPNQSLRKSPHRCSPGPSSTSRRPRSSRSRSPHRHPSSGRRTPTRSQLRPQSSARPQPRSRTPYQSSPQRSSQTMYGSGSPYRSQHHKHPRRSNREAMSTNISSQDENNPDSLYSVPYSSRAPHPQSSPGDISRHSPFSQNFSRRGARSQSPTSQKVAYRK